jgi:inward rectifier potassium channel
MAKNTGRRLQKEPEDELGFGSKYTGSSGRLINTDGSFNIIREGASKNTFFEHMVNLSWPMFILEVLIMYLLLNGVFAFAFWLLPDGAFIGVHENGSLQSYFDAFFFSIHTFNTIGYGNIYPESFLANSLVVVDAFTGLLTVAIVTGVVFLRFSKAKVSIRLSDNMVIAPLDGRRSLQFRMVNASKTPLINVDANVTATWLEKQSEGIFRRRFQRLDLEMSHIYLLPLNWTVVHMIDEASPLYKKGMNDLQMEGLEFIVMLKAFDNLYGQSIFKNHSYKFADIIENAKFKLMYHSTHETTVLNLEELNAIERL